jgi:Bacterial Ig-like domain (group 3)/MBG domain (YGX type)
VPAGSGGDGYYGGGGGAGGEGLNIPGSGGGGGSSWAASSSLSTRFLGALQTGNGSVTITPLTISTTSATVLSFSSSTAQSSAPVTFTATVTPSGSAGTVAFTAGNAVITGCDSVAVVAGVASCTTSFVTPGARVIRAIYSGTASVLPSTSAPMTETTILATTVTAITSSIATVPAATAVTYTATVSPVPTGGSVTFSRDGNVLASCTSVPLTLPSGVATCTETYAASGDRTIGAVYSGDANYATSTADTFTQHVSGAPTTTTLVTAQSPIGVGRSVSFTATVVPVPTGGTVAFKDAGTAITACSAVTVSLTSGTASCRVSYTAIGTHTISAVYSGVSDYGTSSSSGVSEVINSSQAVFGSGLETFTVPAGWSDITVTAWAGAGSAGSAGGSPGRGGGVASTFAVTPGQVLEVVTGGQGGGVSSGGTGGQWGSSGNGGGASDVRVGACAATLSCGLADRVLVAGAGGGTAAGSGPGGQGYLIECGGDGGSAPDGSGADGCGRTDSGQSWPGPGRGATAVAGGAGGASSGSYGGPAGSRGALGVGGAGASDEVPAGSGGDGYYGGGGGAGGEGLNIPGSGGGGGSSWISSSALHSSLLGTGNTGSGSVVISHAATQIVLGESVTTSLPYGSTRVLTATMEDSGGTVVDTGTDSTPSVTFAQTSGTGSVSGLGAATAVAGVASLTVTGTGVGTLGLTAATTALTSSTLSITVVAAAQTITFPQPASPAIYGTTFSVAPTASSGLPVTVAASGGCSDVANGAAWTVTMTSGTTDCILSASQAGTTNFSAATPVVKTVSASKAAEAAFILGGATSAMYGTTPILTASGGSGTGAVTFSESSSSCTIAASTATTAYVSIIQGAGDCTVTANKAADSNYFATSVDHSVTATPAQLVVNALPAGKVYGGVDPTLNSTLSGFVGRDNSTTSGIQGSAVCSRTAGESVATRAIVCLPGTLSAPNYSFTTGTPASFVISAAPLLITATSAAITYGDATPLISASYSGLTNGDSAPSTPPTCATTVGPSTDVGSYASNCLGASDDDYSITYAAGVVNVGLADQTIDFEQPAQPAGFGSTFSIAPTASSGLAIAVSAFGGCSAAFTDPDWTITMTSGTDDCVLLATQDGDLNYTAATSVQQVVSAEPTFQADASLTGAADVTYGDTAVYTVSGGSGTGGWTFDLGVDSVCSITSTTATTVTVQLTAGVGSCDIVATNPGDANYRGATAGIRIAADLRVLDIDGVTQSKVYGASDPTLDFTLSGFAPGDDSSVVSGSADCQRASGEPVGDYAVSCAPGGLVADNYSFETGAAGQLSITPAALTITASDAQIHFGDPTPVITPSYSGLENGDPAPSVLPVCATAVGSTNVPGTYSSGCSGAVDGNYTIGYADGVVTVLKALQVITFPAPVADGVFGTSFAIDPATSSPLVVSLAATGGCTASADTSGWTIAVTSGSTDCVLTASQDGDSNWASATDAVQIVRVARATQQALGLVVPGSATYGDTGAAIPSGGSGTGAITVSTAGGCSVTGSLSLTFTAAGPCTVTATRTADDNYAAATTSGVISVAPATLMINAANETKIAGDADPTLVATESGFVLADTTSVVSGAADCTRVSGEAAGSYVIACAPGTLAAANYAFTTGSSGSLTITSADASSKPSATTKTHSSPGSSTHPAAAPFSLTSLILPLGIVLLLIVLVGGGIFLVRRRRGA